MKAVLTDPLPKKWFGVVDFSNAFEKDNILVTTEKTLYSYKKNNKAGEIISGKNIYINSNDFINNHGYVHAQKNLLITGNTFENKQYFDWERDKYISYVSDESKKDGTTFSNPIYKELILDIHYKIGKHTNLLKPIIRNEKVGIHSSGNLVIDFIDKINIVNTLPDDIQNNPTISYIIPSSLAITAKNIILNSKNVNISSNLQSGNDLSIIAGQNININNAQIITNQSQSLIAGNDLTLKQVNLTTKDSTLIAKNGNIQYSLNPISAFKDNVLSAPVINAANSLHIQAGKNITFDNAQLVKTNKLTLSANDNILIRRDESSLIKLAAFEPAANINALLAKTGNWTSSGEINLTAGKNIEARGIAFNSGKSLTANAGQDILLGSKAIKDVDNVFKTHRYPELRSQLITNGNITLNAARDIDLQSANLQSKDKIIALSGRDIKLTATAYSAIPSPHEDNQDVRYVTSTLSGDKGVTLASNRALTTQGSTIKSLGDITISSGGNVRLESVKTHYRKQSGKRLEDLYRQIGTEINSGKTLTILSEGSILFQASRLVAKGTMDIAAKGGYLYAQAMEETSHYEEQKKKCNKWTLCITKKEVKKTRSETKNKVTEFTAGGDINLYAKDDVTLEATKINAGKNAKITSQTGKVNFRAVKNTTFEQVISNSKGFYITQQNKGYTEGKWILPSLHIGGKLTVDANKGITADVKTKEGQSFEQALAILSRTPEYEWLGGVKNNKNVNWVVVKDAYSQWNKKSEKLNPVVGAVIAIAAAAATYGTSTAASIGGLASSTATTMGASATTASVASAAAQAGFASLISQASVALAENKGNLSKTLSSLGQNDTVKSIVASMIIAGSLEGFDIALYGKVTDPAKVSLPKLSDGNWTQVAQRVAGQSAISSTIGTAIQGGSFSENFKTALLSNVAGQIQAEGANLIGDKFQYLYVDKQGQIIGHTGKALSHMALAGLSAEISGANVKGAVVGALAAEIASISLDSKLFQPQFESEAAKQVYEIEKALKGQSAVNPYLVKFIGGLTGALVTNKPEGAYSAANSAELVYRYNDETHYISPSDIEYGNDLYLAMKGDKTAQQRVDARDKALVYSLSAGALGYTVLYFGSTLVAVAPELVPATKTAFTGCKAAPTICASNVGAHVSNIVVGDVAPAATTGSFLIIGKNAAQIENVVKPAYEEVKTLKELFKYDTPSAKAFLSQSSQRLQAANLAGQKVTLNYKVLSLDEIKNPALNVSLMRNKLTDYVKGNKVEGISIAAGAIKINGKTDYILAVSGKSWKGDAPKQINIDGINYKVVVSDSKSVPSTPTSNGQTNYNHAEQKLFSDINDNYKGKNAEITIAVENTSKSNPGMCVGCQQTSLEFAKQNERFNITIYQGTTGTRKQ